MKTLSMIYKRVFLFVFLLSSLFIKAQEYSGGTGGPADPYKISTAADLQSLALAVNGKLDQDGPPIIEGMSYKDQYFIVTADIDLKTLCGDGNNGSVNANWEPIGSSNNDFKGSFDGNGHSISGLYFNGGDRNSIIGLFGHIDSASIKNICLQYPRIKAINASRIGAIVAGASNSHLENIRVVDASIEASTSGLEEILGLYCGGIIGSSTKSTIEACFVSGLSIITSGDQWGAAGGILGHGYENTFFGCVLSAISIKGQGSQRMDVGGILGGGQSSYITACLVDIKDLLATTEQSLRGILTGSSAYCAHNTCYYVPVNGIDPIPAGPADNSTLVEVSAKSIEQMNSEESIAKLNKALAEKNSTFHYQSKASGMPQIVSKFIAYQWYLKDPSAAKFIISNANELKALATIVNGSWGKKAFDFSNKQISLAQDIDLKSVCGDGENGSIDDNWMPIGTNSTAFKGSFYGNGKTVKGLYVDTTIAYQGLFGFLGSGANVSALTLEAPFVKGVTPVGALAGGAQNGRIEMVNIIKGAIAGLESANPHVGGVIGDMYNNSQLIGCRVSGTSISYMGTKGNIGGVVGISNDHQGASSVISCVSSAVITSTEGNRGILIGASKGNVLNSYYLPSRINGIGGDNGKTFGTSEKTLAQINTNSVLIALNTGLLLKNCMGQYQAYSESTDLPNIVQGSMPSSELRGVVRNTKNKELSNVLVRLMLEDSVEITRTTTSSNGTYAINVLNHSDYTILLSGVGYTGQSSEKFAVSEDMTKDFILSAYSDYAWYINDPMADTFYISNAAEFKFFSLIVNGLWENSAFDFSNKTVLLMDNIDLSSVCGDGNNATMDTNWTPIGVYSGQPFKGVFDGGGYSISGLYIDNPTFLYQGLFGYINGSTLKNFSLLSPKVEASRHSGLVVGAAWGASRIEGIRVENGDIKAIAEANIGGIVGEILNSSTVIACEVVNTKIYSTIPGAHYLGGLVGSARGGSITGCFSNIVDMGENGNRGLISGYNERAIQASYFTSLNAIKAIDTNKNMGATKYIGSKTIAEMNQSEVVSFVNVMVRNAMSLFYYQANSDLSKFPEIKLDKEISRISGTITNANHIPLKDVLVRLMYQDSIEIQRKNTDTTGMYEFVIFPNLAYTLQLSRLGYSSDTLDIEVDKPITLKNIIIDPLRDYAWYMGNPSAAIFSISNAAEFKAFGSIVNNIWGGGAVDFTGKSIVLTDNIDLSSVCGDGTNGSIDATWIAIGEFNVRPFKGTFNGGGYAIRNLYIGNPGDYYQGLFGYIVEATLSNFSMHSPIVKTSRHGGLVVGAAVGASRIEGVSVHDGQIYTSAVTNVGGIAGEAVNITNNIFASTVYNTKINALTPGAHNLGGLVGSARGGSITGCLSNIVDMGENGNRGLIAGRNERALENCYYTELPGFDSIKENTNPGATKQVLAKTIKEMNYDTSLTALNNALMAKSANFHYQAYPDSTKLPKIVINPGVLYSVNYDLNGAMGIAPSTQIVKVDSTIALALDTDFEREGYTFVGWNTHAVGTGKSYTAEDLYQVKTDMVLYAQWMIKDYMVSFNSNGGTEIVSVRVNYNERFSKPINPVKLGYSFSGWFKEAALINAWNFAIDKVSSDTILYAKWTINTYMVSFNSNGGSTIAPIEVDYNSLISEPTIPTKTGYSFDGWFKEAALTNAWDFATDKVSSDTILYAKWTINTYMVSFNSNGGSTIAPIEVDYNSLISEPTTPTKAEYVFDGWFKEAALTNAWDFAIDKVSSDTILYAKWTEKIAIDEDAQANQGVILYPNPVLDRLQINSSELIQEIEIYNMLGRLVLSQKGNQSEVNVSMLKNAYYIVKIRTDKRIYKNKIFKK